MKNWLDAFFSNSISRKINKDYELKSNLIKGMDVSGFLVVVYKDTKISDFLSTVKLNNGFYFDYGTIVIGFFSKYLHCPNAKKSFSSCCEALLSMGILFGTAEGEILIGALNSRKPIVAGMAITNATKNI